MPERAALYRRYRPQTFAEIVGQEHVTRTLKNAIARGQVAHAYLLAGARGTGKTSIARLIAKAVNCPKAADGEPCDRCDRCVEIREGRFLDLIEIDAASNRGIDEMRDLREKVRFTPSQGQYKVYVIDEAHQLTPEAFNALLKTLEEPPPHAIFVLATTESQRIPATIVSRTQRFDLRRIPHQSVLGQLDQIARAEGWTVEPAALEAIARHAQGSLRDAESILDQLASFAHDGGEVRLQDVAELLGSADWEEVAAFFDALAAQDGAAAVTLVGRLADEGRELRLFVRRSIDHIRALVQVKATGRPLDAVSDAVAASLAAQAQRFTLERLARIAKRLVETEQQLRTGEGTPLPLELAALDLTTSGREEGAGPRGGGAIREAPAPPAAAPRPAARPSAKAAPERSGIVDLAVRRQRTSETAGDTEPRDAPTMETVREAWKALVDEVRGRSVAKAAQLVAAEPLTLEGGTLVIGFANEFARAMWQDKQRGELERSLSALLGSEIRVRCVKTAAAPRPAAVEDPMLRAANEIFRRSDRILEVE